MSQIDANLEIEVKTERTPQKRPGKEVKIDKVPRKIDSTLEDPRVSPNGRVFIFTGSSVKSKEEYLSYILTNFKQES